MSVCAIAKVLNAAHVSADILLSGLRSIVAVRDVVAEVHETLHTEP
jgi:hypothetical protein